MAGGGGPNEATNPLPMNVVPLIDVIFCLLLFFMCSFHFKSLEGKLEAWLPKDKGMGGLVKGPETRDVRVSLDVDASRDVVVRHLGRTEYPNDKDLAAALAKTCVRDGSDREAPTLVIDAAGSVPWQSVVTVLDLARIERVPRVGFALAGR